MTVNLHTRLHVGFWNCRGYRNAIHWFALTFVSSSCRLRAWPETMGLETAHASGYSPFQLFDLQKLSVGFDSLLYIVFGRHGCFIQSGKGFRAMFLKAHHETPQFSPFFSSYEISDHVSRSRIFGCQRYQRYVATYRINVYIFFFFSQSSVYSEYVQTCKLCDKLLHVISIILHLGRMAIIAGESGLFLLIFQVEAVSRVLGDSWAVGPSDTKLVRILVISCNAYNAVLHLACFVYPLSCLVSGNLVESSFGSLHNKVPLHELCVDLWCCHFKQFYIRKIHRSASGIVCVIIDCEPWQHCSKHF